MCEICEVWSCVDGRSSGSGPSRREDDKGPWVEIWSSRVGDAGGLVRFLAYTSISPYSPLHVNQVY